MFNVLEIILYNVLALSMHCRMQSELLTMTLLSISMELIHYWRWIFQRCPE